MPRLICLGFVMLLILSGCSSDETPTRHNDFTPLTSIQIVAAAPSIAAHTSTKLSVIGNYSGLFTRDITDQAVWSSTAPTVADFITAASPSRVTGNSPGTAILTATVGSVSAPFTLTVTSATVTTLAISPAAPSLPTGLSTQFTASGTFSDGTTQDLTFDATWASSAPTVGTVGDTTDNKGLAQALAVGTATITATFGGVSGSTPLSVTEVALQSIAVSPANPSILSLSTGNFTATGQYSDGSTADITSQVVWNSSQTSIAAITSGGAVTTLASGTTSISASLNGVSGTSSLKVTGGNLIGIALSPANPNLILNAVVPITATGSFNNGSSRDITGVVAWSVANTNIATVTTPGGNQALLNALAASPAPTKITATSGSVTASTNLTVTAPLPRSITISPTSLDLPAGTSSRLTATAKFSDGTTQDVTASTSTEWTSDDTATASVDDTGLAKGRVHGVAAGLATISAKYQNGSFTATVTVPVTVRTGTVSALAISGPPTVTVGSGNQVTFTATATYSDASTRDVTADTVWSIDQLNVAILADSQNQPGQVVAVDTGSATLTASFGGKTQTVTLRVP